MNAEFYIAKRKQLIDSMKEDGILVLFSGNSPFMNADAHHEFVVNSNFYYLTGIEEEGIILLISKVKGDCKEALFIKRRDPVLVKWVGETIQGEEATAISGVENIHYVDQFEKVLAHHLFTLGVENVYVDIERKTNHTLDYGNEDFVNKVTSLYPQVKIKNVYPTIAKMRTIKSEEEIEELKKAIAITDEGLKLMLKNMKPGMKEHEIEAYYDFVLTSHGVKQPAFTTIAAGGKRACVLHYEVNNGIVNDGECIMFDLGARSSKRYCADISRTYPVNGKFTPRQKQLYNIVLKAHDIVMESIKPGETIAHLQELVIECYTKELTNIGLIKSPEEVAKYYYHSVSHMLGIDTHDVGYLRNDPLVPNMVLTVEPGLYIEEEAIGIRIENDALVTDTGCINLSDQIIRTVEDIEAFMKK